MAGHINLISEVENAEVQILAALIRRDTHGESDGGPKNAMSALWGSVLCLKFDLQQSPHQSSSGLRPESMT